CFFISISTILAHSDDRPEQVSILSIYLCDYQSSVEPPPAEWPPPPWYVVSEKTSPQESAVPGRKTHPAHGSAERVRLCFTTLLGATSEGMGDQPAYRPFQGYRA
ncbi:MAG TPA: hypothetical protein VJV04_05170, partial [Nitrospiraceae bacterium]|nr:hypothetical protein [Nitrospiraceae bacterium]